MSSRRPISKREEWLALVLLSGLLIGSCMGTCEFYPDSCGPYGQTVIARQVRNGTREVKASLTCEELCGARDHRIVDGICYCALWPNESPPSPPTSENPQ